MKIYNNHEMILIPEGISYMGSDELDPYAGNKEKPLKEVFISDYYISKYPTTNFQFANFLSDLCLEPPISWDINAAFSISDFIDKYGDFPVNYISWKIALHYCKWLSEKSGLNIVLPTEAEWEKAARGNLPQIYPWGNDFNSEFCNCTESGRNGLCSVFELTSGASPYGCLHMSGNVWEWCEDFWDPYFYKKSSEYLINPVNLIPSAQRVVKGGSAYCSKEIVRVACRDWTNSINQGGGDDGFRIAIRDWR